MKTYLCFLLCILCSALVHGQASATDPSKDPFTKLEHFRTGFPQEKVYLHLDKPYYTVGDSIWFKAYVVDAEDNQPSALSRILYVELINEKDSITQSLRLPMAGGLTWGDFTLADTLKEGNYRIRAYTNWMRNFSDEYFFDKTILIGNSLSNNIITNTEYTFNKTGNNEKVLASITYTGLDGKPIANKKLTYDVQLDRRNIAAGKAATDKNGNVKINFVNNQPSILKSGRINTNLQIDDKVSVAKIIPVKATSNTVNMQFFPESGQLVNNIRSKVAFKAMKADGLGIEASGVVIDNNNNKIAEFKTSHAGMGSFTFMPLAGNSYTAIVKFADGSERNFTLPKAAEQGYVLAADNSNPDSILVKISISPDMLNSGGEITLAAQANSSVKYVSKARLTTATLNANLPKSRFPTGILQLTLFSQANEPVAERLVFIQHDDQLNISLNTDKTAYSKRGKVQMTVNVSDAAGKPVQGNFSMAITDQTLASSTNEYNSNIYSNLLLTSDLKGYIESPGYYFTNADKNKTEQLDDLMLTQGWRRFLWKNIINDTYPPLTYAPERSIEVSGRVVTAKQVPVPNAKVTLLSSGGDGISLDTLTDKDGRFVFQNLYFNNNTKFIIQARTDKGRSDVDVQLNYWQPAIVTKKKYTSDIEINVNESLLTYLQNRKKDFDEMEIAGLMKKTITLSTVKITGKKSDLPDLKDSRNLNGAGEADLVLTSKQFQTCSSLMQCLQSKAPGLYFQEGLPYLTRNNGRPPAPIRAGNQPPPPNTPMLVVVDGLEQDRDTPVNVNPWDIASVEILKDVRASMVYGARGNYGILIITIKRGDEAPPHPTTTPGIVTYNQQGFYMGRQFYSPDYADPKVAAKETDRRTTVYWNPTVVTDASGKAVIEYFNADGAGQYRAVIEGLNAEGKTGRQIYNYSVK